MRGSEKINKVLAEVKMKPAAFAKAIGLKAAQNIYDIQKDKINISKDVAAKISSTFPFFEVSWLLTGEGEMLKSDAGINEAETHKTLDFSDLIKINEKTAEAVHIIANSNAKMADAIQTSARSFETLAQTNAEMWQTIKGKLDRIEELLEKKGGNAQGRAHAV